MDKLIAKIHKGPIGRMEPRGIPGCIDSTSHIKITCENYEEIKELKYQIALRDEIIVDLYNKVEMLYTHVDYSPGGQGYNQTEEHFDLINKNK